MLTLTRCNWIQFSVEARLFRTASGCFVHDKVIRIQFVRLTRTFMGHQQNSSAKYKAIIILFGMEKGMERREIPARKKSHERNSRIAITTQTIQLEQIVAEHFLWLETYCNAKIRS